jgi:hypothetical protein
VAHPDINLVYNAICLNSATHRIKAGLRSLARSVSPTLLDRYQSHRLRAYFKRRYSALQDEAREVLFGNDLPKVLSGPFEGMPYLHEIVWGPITPKWIGSYEAELQKIVERILSGGYSQIVNVGCAEGYYAVGLASLIPGAEVFAFDLDPIARKQTTRLASLAGVADRVNIGGNCTGRILEELISDNTLLAIDIEGFEVQLLDPNNVDGLARASLLVEVHSRPPLDLAAAAEILQSRFEPTHHLRWFNAESRELQVYRYQHFWDGKISAARFAEYLDEGRSEAQRWFWAEPKAKVGFDRLSKKTGTFESAHSVIA